MSSHPWLRVALILLGALVLSPKTSLGTYEQWLKAKKTQDEGRAATLSFIASIAAHQGLGFTESKGFTCPVDAHFFEQVSISLASEDSPPAPIRFIGWFSPILLGKSVELLQADLCRWFLITNLEGSPELDAYCDDLRNSPLSKASAKSLGKATKALQIGKSGYTIAALGLSSYLSVRFSEMLLLTRIPIMGFVGITSLIMAIEQFSAPQAIAAIAQGRVSDYYVALDHWLTRPVVYRTMATSCRYSLEKLLQNQLFGTKRLAQITSYLLANTFISARSANILGKATAIGSSKIITGAMAASVLSTSEIILDALARHPELKDNSQRTAKYLQDIATAAGTNMIVSIALPTILVAGKPRRIAIGFLIANVLYWLIKPEQFLSH